MSRLKEAATICRDCLADEMWELLTGAEGVEGANELLSTTDIGYDKRWLREAENTGVVFITFTY